MVPAVLLSTITAGAEAGWLAGGSEEWGPSAGLKFWELQERRNIVSDNAQMYFFILFKGRASSSWLPLNFGRSRFLPSASHAHLRTSYPVATATLSILAISALV